MTDQMKMPQSKALNAQSNFTYFFSFVLVDKFTEILWLCLLMAIIKLPNACLRNCALCYVKYIEDICCFAVNTIKIFT